MGKFRNIFALLLAALILVGSSAGAKASGAVNNDMVLGFVMGFAQNNTVQAGNFLAGATGTALGGAVTTTGGNITNIGTVVGSGGLTGGLLGGAFSGALNATGINGLQSIDVSNANPMNSIGTGFVMGQMMAGLNTSLATQGLSLGSIAGMTIPGLNGVTGGVGTNTSIGAIVTSVMGQSATASAITGLMNGGLLGNTLGGVTGAIQGGAASLLLNSLGVGGTGNNMGLSTVGQMALGSLLTGNAGIPALSGLTGLSGLASLNLMNSANGGGLLGTILSGGSGLTSAAGTSALAGLLGGNGNLFGTAAGGTNPSALFANGQTMMQNAGAVAQNLMAGNFLGAAVQNAINSAVGSAIGQTVNNMLGSGLSGLLGAATGALSAVSQAVTGALGAVTSALGNMFSSLFGGGSNPASTAANAAANAATAATNAFSSSLAGMLNCIVGNQSPTSMDPTPPANTGVVPPITPGTCDSLNFRLTNGSTVSINLSDPNASQRFATDVMLGNSRGRSNAGGPSDTGGEAMCTAATTAPLLQRLSDLMGTLGSCDSAIRVTSTYRSPGYNRAVGGAAGSQHVQCKAIDFNVDGVAPSRVQQVAPSIPGMGGVGRYSGFTHIDVGSTRNW